MLILPVDFDCVLVRYGEIGLKGGNRGYFERKLVENIKWSLKRAGVIFQDVRRIEGRFLVTTTDIRSIDAISRVFGVVSFSPAVRVDNDIVRISSAAVSLVQKIHPKTFRISSQRLDKRVALTSQKINEIVGAAVVHDSGTKVSLKDAELDLGIDLTQDSSYLYISVLPGLGGLPLGVSSRVICMLSGGIDSPVAAWMMMKRGCPVTLLHFMHEGGCKIPPKIDSLRNILAEYGPGLRLIILPAAELERDIIMKTPSRDRIVVLRRMFLKAAVTIMKDERAHAIVTGDNVGQVASQTIENMEAIQAGTDALVLRPLAGLDKQEIIDMARRIGTYSESTVEYADCCSFLVPKHPQTKASAESVSRSADRLDPGVAERVLTGRINT